MKEEIEVFGNCNVKGVFLGMTAFVILLIFFYLNVCVYIRLYEFELPIHLIYIISISFQKCIYHPVYILMNCKFGKIFI